MPSSPSCATFAGGSLALRLAHSLPTLMALTGGIVVAVALFDVLPESIEAVDDAQRVDTARRARVHRLLRGRAGARPAPSRRCRARSRPRPGRGARRARALDPQLHRRARDRARVRARHRDRGARVHRRGQPRLRRRPEHGELRPQPVRRPEAGQAVADDRRLRAVARGDRRLARSRSPSSPSASCSRSTPASSSTWAPPTCCPRPTASTRRGRGSRSPSAASSAIFAITRIAGV